MFTCRWNTKPTTIIYSILLWMFINNYLMPWSANWHSSCFIWACEEFTLNVFRIFSLLVCFFHFKICWHRISVKSTIIILISTVLLLTWASSSSTFRWPNLAVQKSVRQEFNLIGEFWNLVFKSMIWITATCLMVAVVTMDCKCKSEFIPNYQLLFANSHFNSWHLDQLILFSEVHNHSSLSLSLLIFSSSIWVQFKDILPTPEYKDGWGI